MDIKIDISEHARYLDKISVLGAATDNGNYKKNVCLMPRTKKRIVKYASKIDKIHAIMVYFLIKNEIQKYSSIHLCCDVSKNKLINNLRKLFRGNKTWVKLEKNIT